MLTFKIPSVLHWVNDAKKSNKPVPTGRHQLAELDLGTLFALSPTGHQTLHKVSDEVFWALPKVFGAMKELLYALRLDLVSKGGNFGPIAKSQ